MTKPSTILATLMVLIFCHAASAAASAGAEGQIGFNRDIRPVLVENCFACHGPDPGGRKGGLRFDRQEGFFTTRKDGTPVVKGDLQHSLLYQRITSTDSDEVMPPPKTHKTLTAAQKELIRQWIMQGAPWQPHWSWITPVRPALPAVKNAAWARNPIDQFVLARLEAKGLSPAPEADRRQLIRRLSLDLTGLPPTPAEVEAFLSDQSKDAYERVVDRLLASPAYGEHRARYWLDAARYADTHGLHFDNYREVWPYRQWVIEAFNRNEPFDQFTTEQLAGDLLPNRTLDQQIASGYVRCNETTNEGGTIPEENLVLYARDRTDTAARMWLGLTAGCAVCHDHKFDPITARDFYSLSAFFNNGTMAALDGNIKDSAPSVVVPRLEDRPRWMELAAEESAMRVKIADRRRNAQPDFDGWLATASLESMIDKSPVADVLSAPLDEGRGASAHMLVNGQPREVALASTIRWDKGEVAAQAVESPQGMVAEMADVGDFDSNQAYSCSVWARLPGGGSGSVMARMDDKDAYRGWDMWTQENHIGAHLINHWSDSALKVVTKKPIDPGKWHHLCITYDGKGKAKGMKIFVDGKPEPTQVEADTLKGSTRTGVPFKIGRRNGSDPIVGLVVQDLRIYGRALTPAQVVQLATMGRVGAIVRKSNAQRTEAEKKQLYDWWLDTTDATSQKLTASLEVLEKESNAIKARGAETLVMGEKPEPATAFVLFRGDYDKRRDQVKADTPASLPPFPEDAPRNRLGLAKWLLEPQNPLTSRVAVNRYWQEIFGTGIVKTSGDFGIMGEQPSHPELLDWLAVEFRESGWDIKHMFKLMVMTSTYRQAAIDAPQKLAVDPDNRLLARGPRYRLDAEMLRDQALAASGLLVQTIGGPSVRPYQPPGIWDIVGMPGGDTRNYVQDHGDNLYRRSLYTFWKRQAPPPALEILNAPNRESCTVRRDLTDTPLQALVTMNDTTYVEASRVLAQHAMESGGPTVESRLNFITGRLLARPLREDELRVVKPALDDLLAYYTAHADDASKLLSVGEAKRNPSLPAPEHAAWTMLASQIMNLDECLNK